MKCNQEKPETEFYLLAHDGYAQHRMPVCTECHEARVRRQTVERKQGLGETTEAAMTGLYEAETKNGAPDNSPRPRRMLSEKQVLDCPGRALDLVANGEGRPVSEIDLHLAEPPGLVRG
jgi:hypothetical protein